MASNIKKDIAANLVGSGWNAILAIGLVPIYIHFMGIEAYGLVGFLATMQVVFGLLDMGLSTTLNREMARMSVRPDSARDMCDLVRTLEIIYWIVGLIIGGTLMLLAPLVAGRWIQTQTLPLHTVTTAVSMMGVILMLQWPSALYAGGLFGLQRQVLFNVINIVTTTLRGGGAIFVLWRVSPTIQAFFIWQAFVSACHTLLLMLFLWRHLGARSNDPPARFQTRLLKSVWHFAAGTTGLSLQGIIMTQQDKLILSKFVGLDSFGYYSLASALAQGLGRLISPITIALFPRVAQMNEQQNERELSALYHRACQALAILILPAMAVIGLFSREILLLWTRNAVTAEKTFPVLSLLAFGVALNTVMHIPSILQTASGWLALALRFNTAAIIVFLPATVVCVYFYGAIGAAVVWIVYNAVQAIVVPQFLHQRLLRNEKWNWYWYDVFLPLISAILPVLFLRMMIDCSTMSQWALAGWLVAAYGIAFMATLLVAKDLRRMLFGLLTARK